MKQILNELVNRFSDLAASVDALELELAENGLLKRDAVRNRFPTHKQTVEGYLSQVRQSIAALPE